MQRFHRNTLGALALLSAALFGAIPAGAQAPGFTPQDLRSSQYAINPRLGLPGKTYQFSLRYLGCTATATLDGVDVVSTSPDLSVSSVVHSPCALTGTLDVSSSAAFGPIDLKLVKNGKLLDITAFEVVAQAPGPIPPGLSAQVDLTWKVLPRRVTSDNFGVRISKLYYAVEVVIGNNSGYDLQIAAVNFQLAGRGKKPPVPTDSYRIVRGSLQTEQEIGLRNTIVHTVNALGPMLTGATLFFRGSTIAAAHHKGTYEGIVGIFSNPFEKGLELIFPDRTVNQLVQLDNQTLRDGMIIPNNIQQRTLVFISRDLLQKNPAATEAGGQQPKTRQLKTTFRNEFDPKAVMNQLGELVLIGKEVQYLNRVRVVSTPIPSVGGPSVSQVSATGAEQGQSLTLTVQGESLDGGRLQSPDKGIAIGSTTFEANGRSLMVGVSVAADAEPGTYKLLLSTNGGTENIPFTVLYSSPVFASSDVTGNSAKAGDPAVTVSITGTHLDHLDTDSFAPASGSNLTVSDVNLADDKHLSLKVAAAAGAKKGKFKINYRDKNAKAGSIDFEVK